MFITKSEYKSNLEILTYTYWCMSQIRTGRNKEKLTVIRALKTMNLIEENLAPARPLLKYARILSDAVVEGKAKKSKIPATISIMQRKPKLPIHAVTISLTAIGA